MESKAFAKSCAEAEVEVEFDQHQIFMDQFNLMMVNSGIPRKVALKITRLPIEFMVRQRCVGCDVHQYRAKVAK